MLCRLALLLMLLACEASAQQVAIIIDDLGNSASDQRALTLPIPVTFSILPHTPFARAVALKSAEQRREVMLHLPMEALHNNRLGPGALTTATGQQQFEPIIDRALASVPYARGVNNHMGSRLTQLRDPMDALMKVLKARQLYFIDSRTTRFSQAEARARAEGLLSDRRHVFLDHNATPGSVSMQFAKLVTQARRQGYAIGIGHPYPGTLSFLAERLPALAQQGIELVPVSQLLQQQRLVRQQARDNPSIATGEE